MQLAAQPIIQAGRAKARPLIQTLGPQRMVRVRVDLPLFYSPTEAYGSVSGEVEVVALPKEGEVFPWPQHWINDGPPYLAEANQSRIWAVSNWELSEAEVLVTMFGFVCASVSDARDCAVFFHKTGGFELVEYQP